jgi:glycosyltransferase involved in cell wall biosynthesis
VQTGLKFARQHHYDYVIRLDGDGQHDPEQIPAFLGMLQEDMADVVVGSRFLNPGQTMHIPLARRIGIMVFARTVSLLTREKATDTTSGYFALNSRAITTLASFMPQDYPEVEGRVILHKARLRTIEIPTRMRSRVAGVSSINTWRSIYYALKVTVAALVCAIKEIPRTWEDTYHGDSVRTAPYRGSLQPHFGNRDHPTDP